MQNPNFPYERRRKPDRVIKFVNITSAIGWVLIIICSLVAMEAQPGQINMFPKIFKIPVRDYWNISLLNITFIILIFIFFLSMIGIIANTTRQRRKTDKMNKSLIFQAVMSVVGMIILLVNFLI